MKNTGIIILSFIFSFLISSCNREEEKLNNPDLLFSDSNPISIVPYTYSYNSIFYHSSGDSVIIKGFPDTLNNSPEFRWEKVENGNITSVIIASSPIIVLGSEIGNINDIIWQWHSDMENLTDTVIKYSQGRNVINGTMIFDHEPTPLIPGDYYWAVWKWNSEGIKILCSSRQIHFNVKE
jgi:hypothetical protein